MYLNEETACCGLREAANLSTNRTAEAAMKSFVDLAFDTEEVWNKDVQEFIPAKASAHARFRFLVFTQAGRTTKYGDNFANFIRRHELGEVVETNTHINPNSGNPLKIFTWAINWDRLAAWADLTIEKDKGWKS